MKGRQVSKMAGGMKGGDEVKTALLTLKKMRTACTWVKCTRAECGKWRYLPAWWRTSGSARTTLTRGMESVQLLSSGGTKD